MSKTDEQAALSQREYWQRVNAILGMDTTLEGWSYYDRGYFRNPDVEVPGTVARVLVRQDDQLKAAREVIRRDDAYLFHITPRPDDNAGGMEWLTHGAALRDAMETAREAAAKLDNPPKEDSNA